MQNRHFASSCSPLRHGHMGLSKEKIVSKRGKSDLNPPPNQKYRRQKDPGESFRGPHSSYQRVVQGKCPLHFLNLNGVVCSNTSGFQFSGPLARTNFLSALCGLPKSFRVITSFSSNPLRVKKYTRKAKLVCV